MTKRATAVGGPEGQITAKIPSGTRKPYGRCHIARRIVSEELNACHQDMTDGKNIRNVLVHER